MRSEDIYLDANATTPVLPVAAKAAFDAMELSYGNPSSAHITGIKAKYIMENTRTGARQLLGAESGELIFTSGATEGIQTAILSALWDAKSQGTIPKNAKLLYGATEHKAVPESLKHWNALLEINADVVSIPVDSSGILDLDFIAEHSADAIVICTMAVNNETGAFQDLLALERVIRRANSTVKWMVDCVQAMGKMSLNISQTSIDYAPFSGHKLYAPKGIGMLYLRDGAPYTPFIAGGGQEQGRRSGTENLPGIAAMGAIIESINDKNDNTFKSVDVLEQYRQELVDALHEAFDDVVFNNDFEKSVPTTINFAVKSLAAKEIMDLFDAANIRVSSGSACSSKVTGSFVLDAMGLPEWQSEGAIRLSFGPAASAEEIKLACAGIKRAAIALKSSCLIGSDANAEDEGKLDGLIQLQHDGSCSWIIADKQSRQCIIIDPVEQLAERIEQMVRCRNYQVNAIIDTHSHADHESCATMLRTVLGPLMSTNEFDTLGWPVNNVGSASLSQVKLQNDDTVPCLNIGEKVLARLETPGHTNDSISLLLAPRTGHLLADNVEYAFVGDMVLIGGLGRTDFGISSVEQFFGSLVSLAANINNSTILCPSHDYKLQFTTTLDAEMASNCLLKGVMSGDTQLDEFVAAKLKVDDVIAGQQQQADVMMCGALNLNEVSEEGMNLSPGEAKQYLIDHGEAVVLDVREAHEHELLRLDEVNNVENVPLTRLTGFMASLMRWYNKDKEVICICRSGSRSAVVAKTLRRLGFTNARHIQGGVALFQ